jgi:hypothetical protein
MDYCNKDVDAMVAAQSAERDPEKRKKIAWEIDKKLTNEAVRPMLYYMYGATRWQPGLKHEVEWPRFPVPPTERRRHLRKEDSNVDQTVWIHSRAARGILDHRKFCTDRRKPLLSHSLRRWISRAYPQRKQRSADLGGSVRSDELLVQRPGSPQGKDRLRQKDWDLAVTSGLHFGSLCFSTWAPFVRPFGCIPTVARVAGGGRSTAPRGDCTLAHGDSGWNDYARSQTLDADLIWRVSWISWERLHSSPGARATLAGRSAWLLPLPARMS